MIIDRENIKGIMAKDSTIVIAFSIAMFLLLILLLLITYNSKCQMDNAESFYADIPSKSVASNANENINFDSISGGIGNFKASDPLGNESYNPVELKDNKEVNAECSDTNNFSCFKRDRLTSADLLPADANSKWSKLNPLTPGDFTDQSYLNAGHHIGIDTVGQSLRNANLQIRAEPPNPQIAVSPWGISTIEPDTYSHGLQDIGSKPAYSN